MSRIYLHSPSAQAQLLGAERAYMGHHLVGRTTAGILDADNYGPQLARFIDPDHYLARTDPKSPTWGRDYRNSFVTGWSSGLVRYRDTELDPFTISLNTILAIGNDAFKLAARLHGQCEIHAYIEGGNRAWVAGIIEYGLASAVYRDKMGWEAVIEMLRSRDDEPVVTSYSVCDDFPNDAQLLDADRPTLPTDEDGDEDEDAIDDWWDKLPTAEKWGRAMRWLRSGQGPEIRPDHWEFPAYHFGDGVTAFDLVARDYDARLSAKLEPVAAPRVGYVAGGGVL